MDSVTIAVFVFIIGLVVLQTTRRRSAWRERLTRTAAQLRLELDPGGWLSQPKVTGRWDGREVTIDTISHSSKSRTEFTRVRVDVDAPPDLRLEGEGLGSAFKVILLGEDVQSGDRDFDLALQIDGEPRDVLARLDYASRATVRAAVERGARLVDGVVTIEQRGLAETVEALVELATIAHRMATAVSGTFDPSARLVEHVAQDPDAGFRRRCFELLRETDPEAARAAARELLGDEDPELWLEAARSLGAGGYAAARALAADRAAPPEVRAAAVDWLVEVDDRELPDLLPQLLHDERAAPVLAATLRALAAAGETRPVATLRRFAAHRDATVRAAACACAPPDAQPFLLEMLEDPDDSVATVAAAALGPIGTIEAVLPLRRRAEGLFVASALKETVEVAVLAIQSRLGDVEVGRLSVVRESEGAGALSVSED